MGLKNKINIDKSSYCFWILYFAFGIGGMLFILALESGWAGMVVIGMLVLVHLVGVSVINGWGRQELEERSK